MFPDKRMLELEKIDLKWKKVLPWQIIWNSRQITADIEETLANRGDVLRRAISRIYLP